MTSRFDGRPTRPAPAQLTFDLPQRVALDRERFIVTPSNRAAVAWIDAWPAWPAPALVLHGPAGSGRSHLAAVWRTVSGAAEIAGRDVQESLSETLATAGGNLVIEDVELAPERPLLHLVNVVAERAGSMLLIAATAPGRWTISLPDLASRLRAFPVAAIEPPDDALLRAVLVKRLADRQLIVAPEVIDYLLARTERSFAAVGAIAAVLDQAALAGHRPITLQLAREVLAAGLPVA